VAEVKRYALGLDFGTESVRALIVDCATGAEASQATVRYPHGVMTSGLPGSRKPLPPDFALQHPQDYLDAATKALAEAVKGVPADRIIGIGVDFTACTMLPVLKDGTPLMKLDKFAGNPHAWVKLWKHHAAQPEADRINEAARARGERFLKYYSGIISSEWMLPKCWETFSKAPEVYAAADLFVEAGDWFVQQMTGAFCRNSCAAGYKGLWNAELGFPSAEFLKALDPALAALPDKWLRNIVPPGRKAGAVTRAFAARTGLKEGTPVSAATIDAHSGVAGMGVSKEGPMSVIMGTSSCHMSLSRELKLFEGYAGVVKDGILPGYYGYESGQSAVGDIFGWFVKDFLRIEAADPFADISKRAAALEPGAGGVVALDWMNGNRSVLMNANLSGVLLGLTLGTKPEEVYRALVEGTAFGTRTIIDAGRRGGIPADELVVCGGLTKDPMIMQIYADVTGLEVKVSPSNQAVALGAAIFGAAAAGSANGGFDDMSEAIAAMTRPPSRTYRPKKKAKAVYDKLYEVYTRTHDFFGRENVSLMKSLRGISAAAKGE